MARWSGVRILLATVLAMVLAVPTAGAATLRPYPGADGVLADGGHRVALVIGGSLSAAPDVHVIDERDGRQRLAFSAQGDFTQCLPTAIGGARIAMSCREGVEVVSIAGGHGPSSSEPADEELTLTTRKVKETDGAQSGCWDAALNVSC